MQAHGVYKVYLKASNSDTGSWTCIADEVFSTFPSWKWVLAACMKAHALPMIYLYEPNSQSEPLAEVKKGEESVAAGAKTSPPSNTDAQPVKASLVGPAYASGSGTASSTETEPETTKRVELEGDVGEWKLCRRCFKNIEIKIRGGTSDTCERCLLAHDEHKAAIPPGTPNKATSWKCVGCGENNSYLNLSCRKCKDPQPYPNRHYLVE